MRVMTFNIQHAFDYKNKVIDFDLFINAIKKYGADFCGLNEVRGKGFLKNYTNQTEKIADGLGYNRYFGKATMVKKLAPYGNAIMSRFPFKSVETIRIPDPDAKNEINRDGEPVHYESRCIIKSVINAGGEDVCFLVTHFGLAKSERINAVKKLCEIIDTVDIPLILMGDFNSEPDDDILIPLLERVKSVDDLSEPTFPSDKPKIRIDYILYRGLECENYKVINEVYSDHLPIIADFKVRRNKNGKI